MGWYERQEAAMLPPILQGSIVHPVNFTDRRWYRNNDVDGSLRRFIYWKPPPVHDVDHALASGWRCCNNLGHPIYIALSEDNAAPPPGNNDEWIFATRQLHELGHPMPPIATLIAMRAARPRFE